MNGRMADRKSTMRLGINRMKNNRRRERNGRTVSKRINNRHDSISQKGKKENYETKVVLLFMILVKTSLKWFPDDSVPFSKVTLVILIIMLTAIIKYRLHICLNVK